METGETVDNLEVKAERLAEIVWCNHLTVTPRPLVHSEVAHVYLPNQTCYLVVEDLKVKLICPECWIRAIARPLPFH